MKKWILLSILIVALLVTAFSSRVSAQEQTCPDDCKFDECKSFRVCNRVHSAHRFGNTDNTTMTKAEILKERGVPGKGIDKAPGLQKPFNPKSRATERAGKKK